MAGAQLFPDSGGKTGTKPDDDPIAWKGPTLWQELPACPVSGSPDLALFCWEELSL